MSAVPQNVVLDLSSSWGPVLISTLLATAFYGMNCMQTMMYFITYTSDLWYFKALVLSLWTLDTAHEVLIVIAMWEVVIPKFGDIGSLAIVPPAFAYQGTVTSIVALFAQGFYTWRIWRFSSKNWVFPLCLIPLILGQFVAFIMYTAKAGSDSSLQHLTSQLMANLCFAVFIGGSVVDILIAVIMCVLLWINRTDFFASYQTIMRLMNASVTTGTCTAVFSLWASISLRVWPNSLFYPLGIVPLCPLYCNAVLANLNSRKYMRQSKDNSTVYSAPGPSIQLAPLSSYGSRAVTDTDSAERGAAPEGRKEKYSSYDSKKLTIRVDTNTATV